LDCTTTVLPLLPPCRPSAEAASCDYDAAVLERGTGCAVVIVALVVHVGAIDLDVTPLDVERALAIARSRDRERAVFHAPYVQELNSATVERVEIAQLDRRAPGNVHPAHGSAAIIVVLALAIVGCGSPRDRNRGGSRTDAGVRDAAADAGDGGDGGADGGDGGADGGDGGADGGDGGPPGGSPNLIYDGPVSGPLPGWDPASPVPLIALGQAAGSTAWNTTLVRIAADGTLSDNVAARILIYAFEGDPPDLIFDGPVGGRLPSWDPAAPLPLVMMGCQGTDWVLALARIAPDGTLSDVIVDRLLVWTWSSGGPGVLYSGPIDGAVIPWNAASPEPLVMGGALGGSWFATLARIDEDGSLADNLAETITVWGW